MDDSRIREVLARVPLFAEVLDEALLHALAAKSRAVTFTPGMTLMAEGDFGSTMFAIAVGDVSVTATGRKGDEREVAGLGPGDIVGEMSLMTGQRRTATVTAETDVQAIEISKVALEDVLMRAPELIDQFGAVLARRQAERDRAVADSAAEETIVSQIRRFFPSIFGAR